MTHNEAYNQIAQAIRFIDPKLANKRGTVRINCEVTFYRDIDTKKLTSVPIKQSVTIEGT